MRYSRRNGRGEGGRRRAAAVVFFMCIVGALTVSLLSLEAGNEPFVAAVEPSDFGMSAANDESFFARDNESDEFADQPVSATGRVDDASGGQVMQSGAFEHARSLQPKSGSDAAEAVGVRGQRSEKGDAGTPSEAVSITPVADIPDEELPHIALAHDHETVLAQLSPDATASQVERVLAQADSLSNAHVTDADVERGFVSLPLAQGVDTEHAIAQLKQVPGISHAQPDYEYYLQDDLATSAEAGASLVAAESGLLSQEGEAGAGESAGAEACTLATVDDPRAAEQWALESIHAYEAWSKVKTNKRVTVAVLDNGCRVTHEDLVGNIVSWYNMAIPGAGMSNLLHGTHVCGIIAARANNGKGVAGVSYNAGIMPIQVFAGDRASSSVIAEAYDYVMDHAELYNIRVVNMSVGTSIESDESGAPADIDEEDTLLVNAAERAFDAGILTVCSAGNDADRNSVYENGHVIPECAYFNYPSDWIDDALGVIALEQADAGSSGGTAGNGVRRWARSNYNMEGQKTKDICAPGVEILSCSSSAETAYENNDGTSMAAPCVAGVAALVFAANPSLGPGDVADILCNTATDLGEAGWDNVFGAGEVNAAAAIEDAGGYLDGPSAVLLGDSVTLAPSLEGEWDWASSDEAVATVEDGMVAGVGGGVATITATSGDTVISRQLKVFDISFGDVPIDTPYEIVYGDSVEVMFNENPDTGMWIIDTDDSDVATISLDSNKVSIWGRTVGQARVTATLVTSEGLVAQHPVEVVAAPISDMRITLDGQVAHTGSACTPKPTVVYDDFLGTGESLTLVEGQDYDLTYSDNVDVGQASVTITGKGNLTGSVTKTFDICQLDLANAVVKGLSGQVYSGQKCTPEPQVTLYGETLKAGVDFTTSYSNNVDAGQATLVITASGNTNCIGSKTVKFSIAKRAVTLASGSATKTYDGKVLSSPNVSVSGKGFVADEVSNVRATGSISAAGSVKNSIAFTSGSAYKASNYSITKREGTLTVKARSIAVATVSKIATREFSGKAQKPKPVVKVGSVRLRQGSDYKLSYRNNIKAGTARVTIAGKGNYANAKTVTFKITKAANPLRVKTSAKTVSESTLANRSRTLVGAIAPSSNAKGSVTFLKVANGSSSKLSIGKTSGAVTVKRGAVKGVYRMKVKVRAAGNGNYKAKTQTVVVKVRVT